MKIAQLLHTLSYGDAISDEAISIKEIVEKDFSGDSKIFCINSNEKVSKYCQDINREEIENSDVVLLHYSIGSELNQIFKDLKKPKKILLYHNLTPEKWFAPYNDRVAKDLKYGLSELPELLTAADLILADSTYNKEELVKLGSKNVEVFPLLYDSKKWSVEVNKGISSILRNSKEVNILTVGRLAPNKCIEDTIKSFYFYHHKINKNSKIWIVGHEIDTEIYAFELRNLVKKLLLENCVKFVGSVANCELKAYFQNSDLYICMSEHEGFCVPLVEAMNFDLPIIAYDSTAIAETLGDVGLLVKEKNHAQIAEAINLIVSSRETREEFKSKAKLQIEKFSEKAFKVRLKKLLEEVSLKPASLKKTA